MMVVKKVLIGLVLVAGLATFSMFGMKNSKEAAGNQGVPEVMLQPVSHGASDITIPVSGQLELSQRQVVTLSEDKPEYKILVKVGDEVKKGTPIVQYSTEEIDLEIEAAQGELETHRGTLSELSTQASDIQKQKKSDAVKPKKEADKDTGEEIEVPPDVTVKELDKSLADLENQRKATNRELKQAQQQLETLKKKKEALTVKSDFNGTVVKRNDHPGEAVDTYSGQTDQTLVEVADLNKFILKGTISEDQTLQVEEGQNVEVNVDINGYMGEGKVIEVGYFPSEGEMDMYPGEEAGATYPITIEIGGEDLSELRPGYQARADIIVGTREGMMIPLEAYKNDGIDHVYVYEDGRAVRRDIVINQESLPSEGGADDVMEIQVESGLEEGDQLILLLDPSIQLEDNMKVKLADGVEADDGFGDLEDFDDENVDEEGIEEAEEGGTEDQQEDQTDNKDDDA
ncbi:efflux RND transporter periplasmic adaptor subunit [Shouchella lonarensis]|uniref:HlyD family secretion protein n=1 Tax=Shouchella lonarensis TaxID=1464122 RepID=A0A1G6K707_9BACI|nr:HlyD family efflux transporter periplasmic adaptor subunit [Shouchella lonarensis]SDC26116.1 HlyD family secretion protein [Shouchella lonarensis]